MTDTDREARLERIRSAAEDEHYLALDGKDVRWLLSEIDRLRAPQREGDREPVAWEERLAAALASALASTQFVTFRIQGPGWRCRACGERGPGPGEIEHEPDCPEAVYAAWKADTEPPAERVPDDKGIWIDGFVQGQAHDADADPRQVYDEEMVLRRAELPAGTEEGDAECATCGGDGNISTGVPGVEELLPCPDCATPQREGEREPVAWRFRWFDEPDKWHLRESRPPGPLNGEWWEVQPLYTEPPANDD